MILSRHILRHCYRAGVTVTTTVTGPDTDALWVAPANTTVVKLTIADTRMEDASNYTCAPENMVHDNIRLSISQGGLPEIYY